MGCKKTSEEIGFVTKCASNKIRGKTQDNITLNDRCETVVLPEKKCTVSLSRVLGGARGLKRALHTETALLTSLSK